VRAAQGQQDGGEGGVKPKFAGVAHDRSRQYPEHDGHVPAQEEGEPAGPERGAPPLPLVLAQRERHGFVRDQLRAEQPRPPPPPDRVGDREAVGQQAGVEYQAGHGRGGRAAAGQHHARRGELGAAGEDQHGHGDRHPRAQATGHGDGAERGAHDRIGEADQRDVPQAAVIKCSPKRTHVH
jgi:hypothetical protein